MPTEIWRSQLRSEAAGGEGGRRQEKGTRKNKLKSRDTHLAGGEERRGQEDKKKRENEGKQRKGKEKKGEKQNKRHT